MCFYWQINDISCLFSDGKEELVICMPHRGRLNFLTCMLHFPPVRLFQKVMKNIVCDEMSGAGTY